MKQNFAILAVTALLLCSLTACGGDQNNGAANGNVNGAFVVPFSTVRKTVPRAA